MLYLIWLIMLIDNMIKRKAWRLFLSSGQFHVFYIGSLYNRNSCDTNSIQYFESPQQSARFKVEHLGISGL